MVSEKGVIVLAVIAKSDYASFQRVMRPHLDFSYDDWISLYAKWEQDYSADGKVIRNVNVDPEQFSTFIRANNRTPDIGALLMFAEAVASREGN
jgi:hypothetical protein